MGGQHRGSDKINADIGMFFVLLPKTRKHDGRKSEENKNIVYFHIFEEFCYNIFHLYKSEIREEPVFTLPKIKPKTNILFYTFSKEKLKDKIACTLGRRSR